MPQLMPLLWMYSSFILFLIVFILMILFSFSNFKLIFVEGLILNKNNISWCW